MVDAGIGGKLRVRHVAIAVGDEDEGNGGGGGGGGVGGRVADIGGLFRMAAGSRDRLEEMARIGLLPGPAVGAEHGREPPGPSQRLDQGMGEGLGLVRADGEPDAAGEQGLERGVDAREGPALRCDVRPVVGEEMAETGLDERRDGIGGACRGQPLLEQAAGAVADHGADRFGSNRRAPEDRERMVEGSGQVRRGIDEGAVEIEGERDRRRHAGPVPQRSGEGKPGKGRGGESTGERGRRVEVGGELWQGGAMSQPSPAPAVVILAAGRGTRMRSDTHKVLHPIGGRPMLLHLFDTVRSLDPARVVVVVGDRAAQVEAAVAPFGAAIAVQAPQLGTAHAVLQAEAVLAGHGGPVLILFGDVPLVEAATLRALLASVSDAAPIAVLGFRPADPGAYGRIVLGADGRIERMVEARDAGPAELAVPLCNAGMMAVAGDLLWRLLKRVGNANAAGEYYLPDIVMLARAEGLAATVIEAPEGELLGVNSRADLAAAEAAFQARRRREVMEAGVTLVGPETVFLAHDTCFGRDCVVEPFVVFGPGVTLGDRVVVHAHSHLEGATLGDDVAVGPFARLRPGTLLEKGARVGNFVETKKARLGAGAKANHLAYLGDAEVGAGANIGAGTITCNYDGFAKHQTAIGAGAFIGSNSSLVAPVTIGDGAIVGAGSVIVRDVPADSLAVARGRQEERAGAAARFRAAKAKRPA